MPVELPFKLKVDFVIQKNQNLNVDILKKIVNELINITPSPKLDITLNDPEQFKQIKEVIQNYYPDTTYYFEYNDSLEFIDKNINLAIPLNIPNLYQNVKKFSSQNINIILKASKNVNDSDLQELTYIKNDSNIKNTYLQPYLTEKEIINFSAEILNREFLTCATPWLNPIIDANGDLFCCVYNNIGNIKESSILELWNTPIANTIRNTLVKNKNCDECKKCLKRFYDAFLIVDNAKLEYKNNTYKFPSMINYVPSAPQIAIVKEHFTNCEFEVLPFPIFNNVNNLPADVKKNLLMILE